MPTTDSCVPLDFPTIVKGNRLEVGAVAGGTHGCGGVFPGLAASATGDGDVVVALDTGEVV